MARPTARVLQLLELLQASPRTRTTAELAAHLGVDERTVRRYVQHLQDLDVPVRTMRGRYGGVHLAAGSRMPPLVLTDEESLTVALALRAAASAPAPLAGPAVLATTATKITRVLPAHVKARVRRALAMGGGEEPARARGVSSARGAEAAPVDGPADGSAVGSSAAPVMPLTELLLLLEVAVRDRRPVVLQHISARGARTTRLVHPWGVAEHRNHWYLSSLDVAAGEERTFRLDRIRSAEVAPGRFGAPQAPDSRLTADRVGERLRSVPWRHEVVLHAQGSVDAVRAALPADLATVTALPGPMPDDGSTPGNGDDEASGGQRPHVGSGGEPWVQVRMRVEDVSWLVGVLLGLPGAFRVQRPQDLSDLLRRQADRLASASADFGRQ